MNLYLSMIRFNRKVITGLRILDLRLKGAVIGKNVRIAGRVEVVDATGLVIKNNVRIGSNIKIIVENGKVSINEGAIIGNNVRLEVKGGHLDIGINSIINTSSILTCWSRLSIGRSTLIAPFCHITDRNHGISTEDVIFNQKGTIHPISIGDDVWIASSSIILPGVTLGDGVVVGANSVVNKSVDSYVIVAGSPAKNIGVRN